MRLDRAIAMAEADGPVAGLALLDGLDEAIPSSHQVAAMRAELLLRLGDKEAAVIAFDRALALRTNDVVRRHLEKRRAEATRARART